MANPSATGPGVPPAGPANAGLEPSGKPRHTRAHRDRRGDRDEAVRSPLEQPQLHASSIEARDALKEWRQRQEIVDELLTDQHFTAVVALFNDQPLPPHP
jgi:hypothetical protein